MKTLQELLLSVEDDIELFGLSHIIYLQEKDNQTVDYDYLPSELYTEAVTLKELQDELLQRRMLTGTTTPSILAGKNSTVTKKLAVLFPGIGYTCDKPLLYYSSCLARQHGYEILPVTYTGFPKNVRDDAKKMQAAFSIALEQAKKQLQNTGWESFSDILFISKSIGTVVSAAYASQHHLQVRHILFTPLAEAFSFSPDQAIAFHGTADPWASTAKLQQLANNCNIPLFLTEHANHSLETGDTRADLHILETIMKQLDQYMTLTSQEILH